MAISASVIKNSGCHCNPKHHGCFVCSIASIMLSGAKAEEIKFSPVFFTD